MTDHHQAFIPPIEMDYKYVVCWNGGQETFLTLGATFAEAGDRVKRGEAVHIYPIPYGVPQEAPKEAL